MTGVMVTDGIKSKVAAFLYFFEIFNVSKTSPRLQMVEMKSIFVNKVIVNLKGSRGKYIMKCTYIPIKQMAITHRIYFNLVLLK